MGIGGQGEGSGGIGECGAVTGGMEGWGGNGFAPSSIVKVTDVLYLGRSPSCFGSFGLNNLGTGKSPSKQQQAASKQQADHWWARLLHLGRNGPGSPQTWWVGTPTTGNRARTQTFGTQTFGTQTLHWLSLVVTLLPKTVPNPLVVPAHQVEATFEDK